MLMFAVKSGKLSCRKIVLLREQKVTGAPPSELASRVACLKEPGPASASLLTSRFVDALAVRTKISAARRSNLWNFILPPFVTVLPRLGAEYHNGVSEEYGVSTNRGNTVTK